MKILRIIEVVIIIIGLLYIFAFSLQLKQLKKELKNSKKKDRGESSMSKIISELIGKKCKITYEDGITTEKCEILDVDNDWVKMKSDSKNDSIKIIRIDLIEEVVMI